MEGYRADRIPWFQYYPVESSLGNETQDETGVHVVDVGGRGYELEAFKSAFANQCGRLVLQDLPETIDEIENLPLGVEFVKHDFFSPQPRKGLMISTVQDPFTVTDRYILQVPVHTTSALSSMTISYLIIPVSEGDLMQHPTYDIV